MCIRDRPTWEQNFSGNAATATEVYVTEYTNDSTDRPLVFAYTSNTANSNNRGIGKDHQHLVWNGNDNKLKCPNIDLTGTITAGTFGTNVAIGTRKFMIPFQGAFDGTRPNLPKLKGEKQNEIRCLHQHFCQHL